MPDPSARVDGGDLSPSAGGPGPAVIAGVSSLDRLADRRGLLSRSRAVIVADEAVVAFGYAERLRGALAAFDDVTWHDVPGGEPTYDSVDDAADAIRAVDDPVVIGVGGGSALDTAKLAAATAGGPFGIERYALGAHPLPQGAPVIAVPTTSGTGSEVTRTCVLSDRSGRKVWAWGDALWPQLVLLDPSATVTMPAAVTAATGLDALVHAVEAVSGRRGSDVVAVPAVRAIRLVVDHLPAVVSDGRDLDGRAAMQQAALLAGRAVDEGGTGIAHSIGHALGTLGHVPHGVAVAVALAAALQWNVDGSPEAFVAVAAAVGVPVGSLGATYRALLDACDLGAVVGAVGPLEVDSGALAEAMVAPENRPMYDNNCRTVDDSARASLAAATLRLWDDLVAAGR